MITNVAVSQRAFILALSVGFGIGLLLGISLAVAAFFIGRASIPHYTVCPLTEPTQTAIVAGPGGVYRATIIGGPRLRPFKIEGPLQDGQNTP